MDPERTKNLNLQLAVLLGDAQAIRECIASGATVAVADAFGNTFLHHVSKRGHWRAARVLLEAKVDPNAANKWGQTPLHLAARAGSEKMVQLLIKNGAHVQVLDLRGHTPLQIASQCRREKVSTVLQKNITAETKISRPKPLKKMFAYDLFHKLDMVVTTEARRTVQDSHGMMDIHKAVVEGNIDYVRNLLESKENAHRKTEDLSTPLHFSAFRGNAEIVQLLLDKGSDANAENETGDTPLHLASLRGHTEAVNLLLERKADPRCSTDSGHTPLHYASLGGFKGIVKKLIEAGADVNALDVHQCAPLHYAASAGHTAVVEDLAESGADLRLSTDAGTSVLHEASFYGRLDTVQKLTEMCPDLIAFRDKLELFAEDTAHVRGQVQPAWWLHKQARREIDKESLNYRAAACKENIKVSGELSLRINSNNQVANASVLASCVDFGLFEIHYQDTKGRTLLHLAAERNDIENIKLLLERGALPTARTFLNKTPGDLAKEKGHLKAFNIINSRNYLRETKESREELYLELLELITKTAYHDAHARTTPYDPEAKDPSIMGQRPPLSAVRKASQLVSSGAPLEPPGSHTCYPLHLAISTNCTPLLPLLLAAGAPLTATREGLGPVQLAWLTPDITTWVGTLVTKVTSDGAKCLQICTMGLASMLLANRHKCRSVIL